MSTDIGGRAVLKPAGNVARANLRKASKPPSPVKPPLNSLSSKFVSPSPLDASPKSLTRTLPLKPNSFYDEAKSELIETSTLLPKTLILSGNCSNTPSDVESEVGVSEASALGADDRFDTDLAMSTPFASASESCEADITPSDKGEKASLTITSLSCAAKKLHDVMPYSTNVVHSSVSRTRRTIKPHIALNKSNSEVFQRNGCSGTATRAPLDRDNLNKLGSLSFNERSLCILVAAKKEAAKETCLQRRLKVSDYGRRQGKAGRIAPEVSTASLSPPLELQRCKFITAQSDPIYVDYHDKEWGVPVHDERMLFELLVLAGFQAELSWTTILVNRNAYRSVFANFDPSAIALFNEKHITSLEADKSLGIPSGKVRGIVNNAQKTLQIVHEFGSLDEYLWGFVNKQPMMNKYRYPKQIPSKTSKSDSISKDLIKRGFRFVGPTIIHSFMQSTGMTNDHLVQCFRHQECAKLCLPLSSMANERSKEAIEHEKSVEELHKTFSILKEDLDSAEQGTLCDEF